MSSVNYFSDYSSGSSANSPTSWPPQEMWSSLSNIGGMDNTNKSTTASFKDLVSGRCTLKDIMKDFEMNGSDSPYTPDEDKIWGNPGNNLTGMGPSSAYLRQKSWPEPDRTPSQRLPRPSSEWISSLNFNQEEYQSANEGLTTTLMPPATHMLQTPSLAEEQLYLLNSLPNNVLYSLLRDLEQKFEGQKRTKQTITECRFCKNNGERESYYRGHALKDCGGRVTCPVLRAFTCARCGARGDHAHTIKYCPLTSDHERQKSTAMMRTVRQGSARRRYSAPPPAARAGSYVMFGETTPSVIHDSNVYQSYTATTPLDPLWAALEQKLML